MVYLSNFDNGEKIDSVAVKDGMVEFKGAIEKPVLVRLVADSGRRLGDFVLEADSVFIENGDAKGGALNEVMNKFFDEYKSIIDEYRQLSDDLKAEAMESTSAKLDSLQDKYFVDNADNAVGYYFFVQKAYMLELDAMNEYLEKYPLLAEYERVKKIKTNLELKAATSEGKMFKDFEIDNESNKFTLSDRVGKGSYVLVDFWASWCGPCMREIETIRGLYDELNPKGLEVIGIAVWDEPDNTRMAVEAKQIPWDIVYDAQSIPTDLYGISGIPCIILFGPDGTILLRDKQGDELVAGVKQYFE